MKNRGTPKNLKQAIEYGLEDGNIAERVEERIRHDFNIVMLKYGTDKNTVKVLEELFRRLVPFENDDALLIAKLKCSEKRDAA